jgi:hypothetical protein
MICQLSCLTVSLARCVESSPSFEQFGRENPTLAASLMIATDSCCFDVDSAISGTRTCSSTRSHATTHASVLSVWLIITLIALVIVAAI